MGQKAIPPISIAEYQKFESESEIKYEFHDGYLVAMAGGSAAHSQLGGNLIWALRSSLNQAGNSCKTFNSDLKIAIDSLNRYYYPDASVVCDPLIHSIKYPQAISNPTLLVEVLSESTGEFDRGKKFAHYRQLDSFREYVLISQEEAIVDVYSLKENGLWQIQTIIGLEASIQLQSMGVEILMKDIYHLVDGIEEK